VIRRSPAESRTRLEQICPRLFEKIRDKVTPMLRIGQPHASDTWPRSDEMQRTCRIQVRCIWPRIRALDR